MVSYGLYPPAEFETAEEVATRSGLSLEEVKALGIERKCRPRRKTSRSPWRSRRRNRPWSGPGGVKPEDVDLVLWTGEEYKDYIAQTAAIRLQEEVGLPPGLGL